VIVPRAEVIVPREPACRQAGVISRQQLLAAGLTSQMIATRLERGRWQQLHWGVYAVFTGPPPRAAWLWAAVLRAGPGAVLKLATELDAKLAHPDQERWRDVYGHPCETALLQARILRQRGWTGKSRPCSPACPVGRAWSS
jgi:hypothetical protein